jgi:hypothetical protein
MLYRLDASARGMPAFCSMAVTTDFTRSQKLWVGMAISRCAARSAPLA